MAEIKIAPSRPWYYHFWRSWLNMPPWWPFLRARSYGTYRLPARGGLILASNHTSYLDPLITAIACRRRLRFFARSSLFNTPVFRWQIASLGAIPMDRDSGDVSAIRETVEYLRNGEALLMYPEGSRSTDGELQVLQPGVAAMALMADAPIYPCYVHGTFESWGRGKKYKPFRLHRVIVDEPIRPSEIPDNIPNRERKAYLTQQLADRLKALETDARLRWPLRRYDGILNETSQPIEQKGNAHDLQPQ